MIAVTDLKALACVAGLALASGAAQAQFEARDLNGDGSIDAFYSPTQDLSWTADANLYSTLGMPAQVSPWSAGPGTPNHLLTGGEVRWTSTSFVSGLNVGGVSGWRMPDRLGLDAILPNSGGCPVSHCVMGIGGSTSELSFLSTLLQTNNPFLNVQNGLYMTSAEGSRWIEARNMFTGGGVLTDENGLLTGHVWAVQRGDVGRLASVSPVPEPETYALMAMGLGLVGWQLRRRRSPSSES